jgi:hypothetical protein
MIASRAVPTGGDFLRFFVVTCGVTAVLTCTSLVRSWAYFASRRASVERSTSGA